MGDSLADLGTLDHENTGSSILFSGNAFGDSHLQITTLILTKTRNTKALIMKLLLSALLVFSLTGCSNLKNYISPINNELHFMDVDTIDNGLAYELQKGERSFTLRFTLEDTTRVVIAERDENIPLAVIIAKQGEKNSALIKYDESIKTRNDLEILSREFVSSLVTSHPGKNTEIDITAFLNMLPDADLQTDDKAQDVTAFARGHISSVSSINFGNKICLFGCSSGKTNSQLKQDCFDAVDRFNEDPSLATANDAARICNLVDW